VWNSATRPLIEKGFARFSIVQLPDGGFNIYADGPFRNQRHGQSIHGAQLAGLAYDDPNLTRARERILALGGLQASNSYVKVNLSLFGCIRANTRRRFRRVHAAREIHLRDVLVDARDRDTAFHRARDESRAPVPAGFTLDEFVARGHLWHFRTTKEFFSWRNFFSQGR